MKIAIYGGSFNPPHNAHLEIAKKSIELLSIDKVIFVPTNISPHKIENENIVSGIQRLEMLSLLIGLTKKIEISDYEIQNHGISYTIETLKYFSKIFPTDELFLIIGEDNLTDLNSWKDILEIKKLVKYIVVPRDNEELKNSSDCIILNIKPIDISSSKTRKYILEGKDTSKMIPSDVNDFIKKNKLYI
ncbi:MAG: nicotinate (nicotinamide) nucleotide adenylyltransferase [Bacteroidota bacterium]